MPPAITNRVAFARRCSPKRLGSILVVSLLLSLTAALGSAEAVTAATFTVTGAGDIVAIDGDCTLREAIQAANTNVTVNECTLVAAAGTDQILFNIPGGAQTINVTGSALPALTEPVTMDAYTQGGASANTVDDFNNAAIMISLNGAAAGAGAHGFEINGGDSRIRGFVIANFSGSGIQIASSNNTVDGNFIGVTPNGVTAVPNGVGVSITSGANNTIGGTAAFAENVISGNTVNGVTISGTGASQVVAGNKIGVNLVGNQAVANGQYGISITGGTGHTVGGDRNVASSIYCSSACNQLSGNGESGLQVAGASTSGHLIYGNLVGLDTSGFAPIPNGAYGILIDNSASNTVGGLTAARRNVASGNGFRGIELRGAGATGNVVQGNYIGTAVNGLVKVGNDEFGVLLQIDANNNVIGGTAGTSAGGACTGACNLISSNGTPRFGGAGVLIDTTITGNNVVIGNYIGTDVNGAGKLENWKYGVWLFSAGTTVGGVTPQERNVISGNIEAGVRLDVATTVRGNYIGTTAAGTGALGNGSGVQIKNSNALVGGTATGAGNLISGNDGPGVHVSGASASGARIEGNTIGLSASGAALPNLDDGVWIEGAPSATVGGVASGAGNIISGNAGNGVKASGAASTAALILGNIIGAAADGQTPRGNGVNGILVDGAPGVIVGGTSTAARNVIGANGSHGVSIVSALQGTVQGNAIGATAAGATTLGNVGAGVALLDSINIAIGGIVSGAGNVIAGNGGHGIIIEGSNATGNSILGNSIHGNVGLAIDLNDDGVTANDVPDTDSGANLRQNFPSISTARFTGKATTPIAGTLTSAPNTQYRIEFFASPTADPTGYGEAQTFLGSTTVTTNASGTGAFTYTAASGLAIGQFVGATATDPQNNTSEVSAVQAVTAVTCDPRPNVTVVTANQGDGRLRVTITASEAPATSGNRLTAVEFSPGRNALVDVGGQDGRTGAFTIPLTDRPSTTTFYVRRATAGQPVHLPLTVYDDCGAWPTFVGAGAGGF